MDEFKKCLFEIKQSKNGLGMFAAQSITRGQIILSEKPLIKLKQNVPKLQLERYIDREVSKLCEKDKEKIFELHDNQVPKSLVGIFKTNGYMLGKKSEFCGLFHKMARINHSCKPNATHHWVESEDEQKVFALRNISIGEEISTSYIDLFQDTLSRKRILKKSFDFDCICDLCVEADSFKMEKSDERRKMLKQLQSIRPKTGLKDPDNFLKNKKLMLKLLEDEEIDYDAYYVFKIAYDIFYFLYKTNANMDSLKHWAKLTYENSMICQGELTGSLKEDILILKEKY